MKKISLKNLNIQEVEQLSREQLKDVLGGYTGGTTGAGGSTGPCDNQEGDDDWCCSTTGDNATCEDVYGGKATCASTETEHGTWERC